MYNVVTREVYCVPVQAKQKTGMWKQFENFEPPVKKKERTHFVVELGPGYRSVQYSTVQSSTVQYRTVQCKCRMRKIEKIQTLDQQTAKLKAENDDLAALAGKLKEQVTFSSSVCLDSNITHNFRCTNSNKNYSGM